MSVTVEMLSSDNRSVIVARQPTLPLVQLRLRLERPATDRVGTRELAAACVLDADVGGLTLREALDDLGATAAAASSVDGVQLSVTSPSQQLDAVVAVLGTAIDAPVRGGGTTVAAALTALRAAAASRSALPETVARRVMLRAAYGDTSSYAVEVPEPDDLDDDAIEEALAWRQHSPGCMFVAAGDLAVDDLLEIAIKTFSRNDAGERSVAPGARAGRWLSVPRPGSVQTCLRAMTHVPGPSDPDRLAAELVQQMLGGDSSSLLVRRLRDDHGWSYHPGSTLVDLQDDHRIEIEVDVATEYSRDAFRVLAGVFAELRDQPLEPAQLAQARLGIATDWARTMDSQSSLADALLANPTATIDPRAPLAAVTAEDVQRIAGACLDPSALVGAAVGDQDAADAAIDRLST